MSKYAFLADENFPLESVKFLRNKKVDVVSVQEIAPGAKNGEVIRLARKEKRVLLTFDKDFGEWAYRKRGAVGIVLFRLTRFTEEEVALLVLERLPKIKENLHRSFTVVESDRLRVTPLPK